MLLFGGARDRRLELTNSDRGHIRCSQTTLCSLSTVPPSWGTICPTCKSWQQQWKNRATYYGSSIAAFATALAITFSGVTYVGNNICQLWTLSNDAEVLKFIYPGDQTYVNPGTNDVFIFHVDFDWEGENNVGIELGYTMKSGTVYHREATDEEKKIFSATDLHHPLISDPNGDGSLYLLSARVNPRPSTCFTIRIFSENQLFIKQLNRVSQPTIENWPSLMSKAR
jgi:hypothetical protein